MTKSEQQRDRAIRKFWKKIFQLGDKLAKAQKLKDSILRDLMELVRRVQALENVEVCDGGRETPELKQDANRHSQH